jgi:hypothetical protein
MRQPKAVSCQASSGRPRPPWSGRPPSRHDRSPRSSTGNLIQFRPETPPLTSAHSRGTVLDGGSFSFAPIDSLLHIAWQRNFCCISVRQVSQRNLNGRRGAAQGKQSLSAVQAGTLLSPEGQARRTSKQQPPQIQGRVHRPPVGSSLWVRPRRHSLRREVYSAGVSEANGSELQGRPIGGQSIGQELQGNVASQD